MTSMRITLVLDFAFARTWRGPSAESSTGTCRKTTSFEPSTPNDVHTVCLVGMSRTNADGNRATSGLADPVRNDRQQKIISQVDGSIIAHQNDTAGVRPQRLEQMILFGAGGGLRHFTGSPVIKSGHGRIRRQSMFDNGV